MRPIFESKMIDAATSPAVSAVFTNNNCDVCSVHVTGTFSSATAYVQGMTGGEAGEWVNLCVINLSTYEKSSTGMRTAGIFETGIEGISQIRVNVTAVSGGAISCYMRCADSSAA